MGHPRIAFLVLFSGGLLLQSRRLITFVDPGIKDIQTKTRRTLLNNTTSLYEGCDVAENSCLDTLAEKIGRVWTLKSIDEWCSSFQNSDAATAGLILVKVPKSASSTAAAVVLRIQALQHCPVSWQHGQAVEIVASANLTRKFLLAPVRDPESRALSSFYFHKISFHRKPANNNKVPSDEYVVKNLGQLPFNYITDYVRLNNDVMIHPNSTSAKIEGYVRSIINAYDFLMVVNRMDESLVLLSLILDIPITTVLTMSSKQAGSWYYNGKRCMSLRQSVESAAVKHYFNSVEWKKAHAADRLLYAAARLSLDRTAASFGNKFTTQLAEYQRLKALIETTCRNETYFPCSENGTPQLVLAANNCYQRDFGCGYPCIDRVALGIKHDRES